MNKLKKTALITAIIGVLAAAAFVIFGIMQSNASKETFPENGNVLLGETGAEDKSVPVSAGTPYTVSKAKTVKFKSSDGTAQLRNSESFTNLDDGSTMAITGGVLLDFSDLSGNFINNYYVPGGMRIYKNGSSYEASTTNGSITFGDHLWKLNDNKYLIQSPTLKVHFADDDEREVKDFVQVSVAEDGIVRLLTSENLWTTLSPECYIQTEGGTKVYPLKQRVEDENYKLSLAGITVNADDIITLTEDEMRRQIVPQINITAIDGQSGDDGTDGTNGQTGIDGINGTDGRAGTDGMDGTNGEDGAAGGAGTAGAAGNAGAAGTGGANGVSGVNGTDGSNGEGGGNGKDGIAGRSGTDAADGLDGDNGADGAEGGAGVSGTDGSNGGNGADGADGVTGNSGADGSKGDEGHKGDDGPSGNVGEDGVKGSQGSGGVNGDDGAGGEDGLKGNDGTNGNGGATGAAGRDASSTTTLHSAIPVITVGRWDITSTGLKGSLLVQDPSGFFRAVNDETTGIEGIYPAYVRITDNETGEEIYCWSYATGEYLTPESTNFFAHINNATGVEQEIYFAVDEKIAKDQLRPDRSYRLEVNAYYRSEQQIYNRTFVSRMFYTDSTGVFLEKEKAETGKLLVSANLGAGFENEVSGVDVYLLTHEQNEEFSLSKTTTNDYIYKYNISYNSGGAKVKGYASQGSEGRGVDVAEYDVPAVSKGSIPLTFVPVTDGVAGLSKNNEYIARAVVHLKDGTSEKVVLTGQELDMMTLKEPPTWDSSIRPTTVTYNRVTGKYEVTRPTVTDPDDSVVSYTYIAKVLEGSEYKEVARETITSGDREPVMFTLPTQKKEASGAYTEYRYIFDVQTETFDNEKTVYYDLGETAPYSVSGTTIPTMVVNAQPTFNSVNAAVTIVTDERSSIKIGVDDPLYLDISCDQYYENTITYNTTVDHGVRSSYPEKGTLPDDYWDWHITVTQPNDQGHYTQNNQLSITLELKDLYNNQEYTVRLRARTRLGISSEEDKADGVYREIGTFTFKTKGTDTVTATWKDSGGTGAINTTLQLTPAPGKNSYESNEITKGQVVLQLYQGQGSTGLQLGTAYITDKTDLEAMMLGDGLPLTDSMFGSVSLSGNNSYTIKVASIADETYNLPNCELYTNTFDTIANGSKIIAAVPTPPALPYNPAAAVTASPIRNSQAATYGYTKDDSLPDDAIIGYTVTSSYDNSAYLAMKVNYYVFEYNNFYDTMEQHVDPVGNYLAEPAQEGIPKLVTMIRNVDTTTASPKLPKVAVIFDKTKTEQTTDAEAELRNEYYVYRVPPLTTSASGTMTGMSRGYRYIFCCTVEYNGTLTQGETMPMLYPYAAKNYDQMRTSTGIGTEHGIRPFSGSMTAAYILNSGMKEVPLEDPTFNTYLYEALPNLENNPGKNLLDLAGIGNAVLYYHYTDPDLTLGSASGTNTIKYDGWDNDLKPTESTTEGTLNADNFWRSAQFRFVTYNGIDTFIRPRLQYSIYRLDYSKIIDKYNMDPDKTEVEMGAIQVDWDWDEYVFQYNANQESENGRIPHIQMVAKPEQNYIQFNFVDHGATPGQFISGPTTILANRAFAAQVTAKDSDGKTLTKIIPIVLSPTSNTYYARLSTGEIAELKPGSISFQISLMFDNGNAGWEYTNWDISNVSDTILVEEGRTLRAKETEGGATSYFGLYSIVRDDVTGGLSRLGYLVQENELKSIPTGGMFAKLTNPPDFTLCLNGTSKTRIQSNYDYVIKNNKTFTRWLYPFEYGVDYGGTSSRVGTADNNLLFPKQVSNLAGHFDEGGGGGGGGSADIQVFIPVIDQVNYNSMKYSIALDEFFVNNIERAKGNTVPQALYDAEYPENIDKFYRVNVALYSGTDPTTGNDNRTNAGNISSLGDETKGYISTTYVIMLPGEDLGGGKTGPGTVWGTCEYDASGNMINIKKMGRDAKGKPTTDLPELKGKKIAEGEYEKLAQNSKFYMTFYMDFDQEDPSKQKNILIGQQWIDLGMDDTKAVFETSTSDGVTLDFSLIDYNGNNNNYFAKGLSFRFNIKPRSYGVIMKYEIFDTEAKAKRGSEGNEGDLIPGTGIEDPDHPSPTDPAHWKVPPQYYEGPKAVAYIDLSSLSETSLFQPQSPLMSTNNICYADMNPRLIADYNVTAATKVKTVIPGTPYWLRLTALDNGGNEVGYTMMGFTPTEASYGTVVGLKNRTQDTIDYTVTISDPQHIFIGAEVGEGQKSVLPKAYQNTGFYAVRITDAAGNLYKTGQEDEVYSFAQTKKLIQLFYTSKTISPNTPYYLNIFAVKDEDVNGVSLPVGMPTTEGDWTTAPTHNAAWFFGNITEKKSQDQVVGYKSANFTGLIDSLWDANGNPLWTYDATTGAPTNNAAVIRDNFMIGSTSKSTAPESGLVIPTKDGYTYASETLGEQNILRMNLKESVGVVTLDDQKHEVQGFKKIEWQIQDQETAAWIKPSKTDAPKFHPVYDGAFLTSQFYMQLIPANSESLVPGREYLVTVNLYTSETAASPTYSFSDMIVY